MTVATNVYLFVIIPKGFFPDQDTGRISGTVQADQDISFQSMRTKLTQILGIIKSDPEVVYAGGYTGGGAGGGTPANQANLFISLKPFKERKTPISQVIARLRRKLAEHTGGAHVLPARAGPAHRGTEGQRHVSVYAHGRQPGRPRDVGAPRAAAASGPCPSLST